VRTSGPTLEHMLFIVIVLDVATGQVPAQALQGEICQVPIIGEKRVKEVS
jgi:hypothetical protein